MTTPAGDPAVPRRTDAMMSADRTDPYDDPAFEAHGRPSSQKPTPAESDLQAEVASLRAQLTEAQQERDEAGDPAVLRQLIEQWLGEVAASAPGIEGDARAQAYAHCAGELSALLAAAPIRQRGQEEHEQEAARVASVPQTERGN